MAHLMFDQVYVVHLKYAGAVTNRRNDDAAETKVFNSLIHCELIACRMCCVWNFAPSFSANASVSTTAPPSCLTPACCARRAAHPRLTRVGIASKLCHPAGDCDSSKDSTVTIYRQLTDRPSLAACLRPTFVFGSSWPSAEAAPHAKVAMTLG